MLKIVRSAILLYKRNFKIFWTIEFMEIRVNHMGRIH